jgi:energy-coupling factor transporter ATP-binding protein EcfA2
MGLPFERLSIHSLRGIQNLELTGLRQVNLLVGANDSGKTSVLEALALLGKPMDPWRWVSAAASRDSGASPKRMLERLRWLFPQPAAAPMTGELDESYEGGLRLSAEGSCPFREVEARFKIVHALRIQQRKGAVESGEIEAEVVAGPNGQFTVRGAEVTILAVSAQERQAPASPTQESSFRVWEEEPFIKLQGKYEAPELPTRLITPYHHWQSQELERSFSRVRLLESKVANGEAGATQRLLRGLDARISGVEILTPRGEPEIYLRDDVLGLVPLSAFGDGIRRALLYAVAIAEATHGVLLVDEIETAIHVSALEKVAGWLFDVCREHDVQLFMTTHSLEAVDAILAADTTEQEDIACFRLERGPERTTVRRYGEDLLKRLRYERGLDVR